MAHDGDVLVRGARLQELEVERVLGAGGFGVTYLAHDRSLDRPVALKEYLPHECATRRPDGSVGPRTATHAGDYEWGLKRFLEEARILAKLEHAHIVRVYRVIEAWGTAYMVMEYIQGRSLADVLKARGPWPEKRVRTLLADLTSGLAPVHAKGLVHRDIKPANIMLRPDGTPVLIDFGAARQVVGGRSELTEVLTPGYAPYEQHFRKGRQGPWTDIYALGAVAYTALTGRVPNEAIERMEEDKLPPVAAVAKQPVSGELAAAIAAALAVRREDRPQSLEDWQELLRAVPGANGSGVGPGKGEPSPSRPLESGPPAGPAILRLGPNPPRPPKSPDGQSRQRWLYGVAVAVVVIAIAVASIVIPPRTPPSSERVVQPASDPDTERRAVPGEPERMADQPRTPPSSERVVQPASDPDTERRAVPGEPERVADQRRRPGEEFRDCPGCPELVVVAAGEFRMGCRSESEYCSSGRPLHEVRVAPFALSKYEATFEEYDRFTDAMRRARVEVDPDDPEDDPNVPGWERAEAAGRRSRMPSPERGRGRRPVTYVSWDDAVAYADWLSDETGVQYRLPSEAEWEYASRAGRVWTTLFSLTGEANIWHPELPVGSFKANAWGLHDMDGGVEEWVQDCWHANYSGAPQDGKAWVHGGDCRRRVVRGSHSSSTSASVLGLGFRISRRVDDIRQRTGFRVARTLEVSRAQP